MIILLSSILVGVIYSIAGWKWSWMRTSLICPLILLTIVFTKGLQPLLCIYPILLGASWAIGYGYNSPLQKFFRGLGVPDFPNKVITRTINAMAIAGSVIVLKYGLIFWMNFIYFVPLYVYLGVFNSLPPRYEEGVIGFTSVLIPFYMIW